jgi:cytochrome P450
MKRLQLRLQGAVMVVTNAQHRWTRRTVVANAHNFPLTRLADAIQGQIEASRGVSLPMVADMIADNAERLARGFEPIPPGYPPGPQGECGLKLAEAVMLGGKRVILVGDPEVAQSIVEEQPHLWGKKGTAFFSGTSLTGNGLVMTDGEVWKRQRRMSNPAFRAAAVRHILCELE